MSQSHFSEDNSHFLLHSVKDRKSSNKRKNDPSKKPAFFTHRSNTKKGVLSKKAEEVRRISASRKNIYRDQRLYFVIHFSDSIYSWKSIQSALDALGGEITKVYDDKTLKIAIDPSEYERFASALEDQRSLILNVRESSLPDKFDEQFLNYLVTNETPQEVTIDVSDLSGLNYADTLLSDLETFVKKTNEHIELDYSTKDFALFSGKLLPKTITQMAEQVEVIESIERLPTIALISYNEPIEDNVELASVVSLSRDTIERNVPVVCVLDGGINRTHAILQGNIAGTYDFTTDSDKQCLDIDGHGSMVSGILVYGGNTQLNTKVLAKALMVKGFENRKPVRNIIQMIEKTVSFFNKETNILNLSFAAFGPNRSLTKTLDDIIYNKNIIVVACTGNIDYDQIGQCIQNGEIYPDYLHKFPIYFPGDSQNAITVGANTRFDSNWIRKNEPSPFTRAGTNKRNIKPDVIFDGGNIDQMKKKMAATLLHLII